MFSTTEWISIFYAEPDFGEIVFVSNGREHDSRFPVAARFNGAHFVGVGPRDGGQIYRDAVFWFARRSLPAIPILPGCYPLESLAATSSMLAAVSKSKIGLSDRWVQFRHEKAKAFFGWVPGETRLEVDPVALVAELNIWNAPLENSKPASLDFYVRAREHCSGELVLVAENEWNCADIPTRSEIERRKLELATSV